MFRSFSFIARLIMQITLHSVSVGALKVTFEALIVLLLVAALANAVLAFAMRRQINRELPPAHRYPAFYLPFDLTRKHRQIYAKSWLRTAYLGSRVLGIAGGVALLILMFAHFRYG